MPPCSPHYSKDDMYLERGDVLVDGYNVYVGCSGNATTIAGIEWLEQWSSDKDITHETYWYEKDKANIILKLGNNPKLPSIVLSGHLDTVPIGDIDQWEWSQS